MPANTIPTKGNLIALRRTLTLANLGFELMDRKRNILIREMMGMIDRAKDLQNRIDVTFREAYAALRTANITLGTCENLAQNVAVDNTVSIRFRSVMGLELPIVAGGDKPAGFPFGFALTNAAFDRAVVRFERVKNLIREMAEVETAVYRLAGAIRKTQKRANALENIVIPDLNEKVKFITEVLDEREREEFVRLKMLKLRKK